jgi:hypothetical protein
LQRTLTDYPQQYFGDGSGEWHTINQTLNKFIGGQLSKRNTYVAIMIVLRDNQDLKQGLLGVLEHEDAHWRPGDFDEEEAVYTTPAPNPLSTYVGTTRCR